MTSQYVSDISDEYDSEFDSVAELMISDVLRQFPEHSQFKRKVIYRKITESWIANSKQEFDSIAQEGEETLMFPQEIDGTTIYLRPFEHNGDLSTQEERERFTNEVDSIDRNKLYSEQSLIPPANELNDNKWLSEILGVEEDSLHELDQRNVEPNVYDKNGDEWFEPLTVGTTDVLQEVIQNKPDDYTKKIGAWAWMKRMPEPVQATMDNRKVSREAALLASGRSIAMGEEIAQEARKTEEDEIHLYHGAGHLVGIYSYLENPEIGDTVYDELNV